MNREEQWRKWSQEYRFFVKHSLPRDSNLFGQGSTDIKLEPIFEIRVYSRESERPVLVLENISMQLLENGRVPKEEYTLDPLETLPSSIMEMRTEKSVIAPVMQRAAEKYRSEMSKALNEALPGEFEEVS